MWKAKEAAGTKTEIHERSAAERHTSSATHLSADTTPTGLTWPSCAPSFTASDANAGPSSQLPNSPLTHQTRERRVRSVDDAFRGIVTAEPPPRTRALQEGGRKVLICLTLTWIRLGGACYVRYNRESSPVPPSDLPSDTFDMDSDENSSDEPDAGSDLQKSDSWWTQKYRHWSMLEVTVQRMEYVTRFASLYQTLRIPIAFVIDAQAATFDFNKKGHLRTGSAIINNKARVLT
ncbi:hypothetical protein B0H19DRAFT_1085005 [Mycena capillaripes]|nr:hypothetical protein B0H19DRAFT_1085005 [Mycena capillaripes]